jgi:hypothetical protein
MNTEIHGSDGRMVDMLKEAIIDPTGQFRYSLWRIWNPDFPKVLFIMLNPSTADADIDDPTIRRCIGFAKSWGYSSLEVVNLFAYRATDPDELKKCDDPVGPDNDKYICHAAESAHKIVLAWGTKGVLRGRNREVLNMVERYSPECLEITANGHPKHPLYIGSGCQPVVYQRESIS